MPLKGFRHSEATLRRMSETRKGNPSPRKGKPAPWNSYPRSEEEKIRLRSLSLGNKHVLGKHWKLSDM